MRTTCFLEIRSTSFISFLLFPVILKETYRRELLKVKYIMQAFAINSSILYKGFNGSYIKAGLLNCENYENSSANLYQFFH